MQWITKWLRKLLGIKEPIPEVPWTIRDTEFHYGWSKKEFNNG